MNTAPFRLLPLLGQVFASGHWLMVAFLLCHALTASAAINGTFTVTETWSVTLYYDDFAGGFTGTRRYSGTQTGTLRITNGEYDILDRTGVQWASPGRDLKGRSLTYGVAMSFASCVSAAISASEFETHPNSVSMFRSDASWFVRDSSEPSGSAVQSSRTRQV